MPDSTQGDGYWYIGLSRPVLANNLVDLPADNQVGKSALAENLADLPALVGNLVGVPASTNNLVGLPASAKVLV